jgi:hypothetical protein
VERLGKQSGPDDELTAAFFAQAGSFMRDPDMNPYMSLHCLPIKLRIVCSATGAGIAPARNKDRPL